MKHLFLDLEDTVITPVMNGWENTELINVQKIKAFMTEFQPDQLHVFSFAIWNVTERDRFNRHTRPAIELSLNMKFGLVPTVDDDIIFACCRMMSIDPGSVDFSEMSNFWGKQGAFRLNMLFKHQQTYTHGIDTEVVLLDDAVVNETFSFPGLRLTGRILNIDQL